CMQVLQPPHSF
nr:immunoglobulin light chain junction region [Macaca mulatta]